MLRSSVISCVAWSALQIACGSNAMAQASPTSESQDKFKSSEGCIECHNREEPRKDSSYVSLTEAKQWQDRDKHASAFKNLFARPEHAAAMDEVSPGVARMTQALNWVGQDGKPADLIKDQHCLSCHVNWQSGRLEPTDEEKLLGVSCQSCHGPSQDWLVPHQRPLPANVSEKKDWKDWRLKPIAEKEALGMIDVRDPDQAQPSNAFLATWATSQKARS